MAMRLAASAVTFLVAMAQTNAPWAVSSRLQHRPLHGVTLAVRSDPARSLAIADTQRLMIRALDGTSLRRIPLTGESNHVPMWAPDGKSLAYQVRERGHAVIAVIRRDGDTPRVFHEAVVAANQSAKWSPDSRSIGFLDPERHRFRLLSVATGSVRVIALDSTAQVGNWMWRPDGRSIAAVMTTQGAVQGLRSLRRRVDEIALDGTQRPLLDSTSLRNAPGVSFIDAYTVFVRYDSAAYRLSLGHGPAQRLVGQLSGTVRPSAGVHATAPTSELWAGLINRVGSDSGQIEFISATTGERRVADVAFRFPLASSPEWTPDGRELIVVGQPPGETTMKLYRVPVDGGEPLVITTIGQGSDGWTSVSPDGKLLVYGIRR